MSMANTHGTVWIILAREVNIVTNVKATANGLSRVQSKRLLG